MPDLASLRFAPEILRRLGEELIPHPDQGIVELARNSYDADARECRVEISRAGEGVIRVVDDGLGMTRGDLADGWLVVGRSRKETSMPTARGRIPSGDKGLGRLAALRMGRRAVVRTRPSQDPGIEYEVAIDWDAVDAAKTVEDVQLEIRESRTNVSAGTSIEISDLRVQLSESDIRRLARALVLLADPFSLENGFQPRLVAPEFAAMEKLVRERYFDEAEYVMKARLDELGRASVTVVDTNGRELFAADHDDLADKSGAPFSAPSCTFDLWVYLLNRQSFAGRRVSVAEVRSWLAVVGGVHVYQNGLRVRPYGDPGHDWLDMNLRRARSPEERPSTNTSVGKVNVLDPDRRLIQKTDREGFVENHAYHELRRFAMQSLDWTAARRVELAERSRRRQRREAAASVDAARTAVDAAVEKISPAARTKVLKAVTNFDRAVRKQLSSMQTEVQLYRTLSTIGTTTAVFAHEAAKPVGQITKLVDVISKRVTEIAPVGRARELDEPLDLIRRSARALGSYAKLPLGMLEQNKRRVGAADLRIVSANMVGLLKPFLDDARITVEIDSRAESVPVFASVASLESVVANLLINCVNAFISNSGRGRSQRQVIVRLETIGDRVLLTVLDNGPGIVGIRISDIWLPGYTTTPGGTGLGLTIVRDTVTDLGGKVGVKSPGELGGAEFTVELPKLGD